jgi:hypothetical protein
MKMTNFKEIHKSTCALKVLKFKNVTAETDGATGSLVDSGSTDILCDAKIQVDVGGTTYWIPLYDTEV